MVEAIRSIVGSDAVRAGDEAAAWAVHGVAPRAVAAPATTEEAAALLERASREGWTVELAGAATALDAGRPPERVDLLITTERLAGAPDHAPADLVASVGAGMPLDALQQRLRPHKQWLPLDPPAADGATVGGMVATAAAGPLRAGHGTPRDVVLGMEVVTGDGRVLSFGGRVVKNVAGYDLSRLVVGSRGTLGLVTRVHLRLRPLPERDTTLVVRAPAAAPLSEAAAAVRDAALEPAALELLSPALAARVGGEGEGWALLARFQGGAERVRDREARLRDVAGGAEALAEEQAAGAWRGLRRLEAGAALCIRFADWPAKLGETIQAATAAFRAAVEADGGAPLLAAHATDGIVRLLVPAERWNTAPPRRWAGAVAPARTRLAAGGGTVMLARGPAALAAHLDPYGAEPSALRLMRGLKAEFDPAGVLAPGRHVV